MNWVKRLACRLFGHRFSRDPEVPCRRCGYKMSTTEMTYYAIAQVMRMENIDDQPDFWDQRGVWITGATPKE